MKWCCLAFKEHFDYAGSRGFAVFASTRDDPKPWFILQHRSLDAGAALDHTSVPLSLVADCLMHYCPWCGTELATHYKKSYKELDRSDLKV